MALRLAARSALVGALLGAAGCADILGIHDPNVIDDIAADAAGDRSTSAESDSSLVDSTGDRGEARDDETPVDVGAGDVGPVADAVAPSDRASTSLEASGDAALVADAGSDAASLADGAAAIPSCAPGGVGMTNCGPAGTGTESCCTSLLVPGGTFLRGYDAVTAVDAGNAATVSSLRVDKYEVTIGRMRQFIAAVAAGWTPPNASGKHGHLNGGNGLGATGGGFETGWDAANWTAFLPRTAAEWNANLSLSGAVNENLPINNVTWYEAYAFCIWDGGFLPSEAEWDYVAAGGGDSSGQRVYPWSTPPTSRLISCSYANYLDCADVANLDVVGSQSPLGNARWGHADMAGNAWEWLLDGYSTYVTPCSNCANLSATTARVRNGGSYHDTASQLTASGRSSADPSMRRFDVGLRCARTP